MATERKLPMPSSRRTARINKPCFCCGTTLLSLDSRFQCACATTTICQRCFKCLQHCDCLKRAAENTAEAKKAAKAKREKLKLRQPSMFEMPEKRRKK